MNRDYKDYSMTTDDVKEAIKALFWIWFRLIPAICLVSLGAMMVLGLLGLPIWVALWLVWR